MPVCSTSHSGGNPVDGLPPARHILLSRRVIRMQENLQKSGRQHFGKAKDLKLKFESNFYI